MKSTIQFHLNLIDMKGHKVSLHFFPVPHPLLLTLFNSIYKPLPYTALEFRSSLASVFGPASAWISINASV